MIDMPLAHSALAPGGQPQSYKAHIAGSDSSEGVVAGARRRVNAMVAYHCDDVVATALTNAVVDAATFHDLGKLDPDVQEALRRGRGAKLHWDHIDAGVAHLRACGAHTAAWIVRAHHAPGLPSLPLHFPPPLIGDTRGYRRLRGRRRDEGGTPEQHRAQIERTDRLLPDMLASHEMAVGRHQPTRGKAVHGLALRLGLSCLVDADHSDSAAFDSGWTSPTAPDPRWPERLSALDRYVGGLGSGTGQRDMLRRAFYEACRKDGPAAALVACEGPVGIGKTTAVTAFLLRRAIATRARRLFVVAPYTAILSQTADRLRRALVLPDERDRPDMIVAEHHHRADFGDISSRDLATLWTAPVILTTAVQFFETLSSNEPSGLRKLHALPGSVVFLDEAHAALPVSGKRVLPSTGNPVETPILMQNWRWLCDLAETWSCSFVLASGSLARFWELDDVVGDTRRLPDLVPPELVAPLRTAESTRVRYVARGRFDGPEPLMEAVAAEPGPRLLIMNTVQSAAIMASHMRRSGHDVLHLSTALCPRDRDVILDIVRRRLNPEEAHTADWTLVATSLLEAGVDLSFRTPFRERFAATSLIQIGGRGNRNAEWPEGITVHDFCVSHVEGLTEHPEARGAADVLNELFGQGAFAGTVDAADVVTLAMQKEMRRQGKVLFDHLGSAEQQRRYPDVIGLGRLISTDSCLVVVDPDLVQRIAGRARVPMRDLLGGSVQIRARNLSAFGLETIPGRTDIYSWPYAYDASFLGYMEGALPLINFIKGGLFVI